MVCDHFLTDTARYADLVLPAALFSQNPGLAVPDAARHLHDLAMPRVSSR